MFFVRLFPILGTLSSAIRRFVLFQLSRRETFVEDNIVSIYKLGYYLEDGRLLPKIGRPIRLRYLTEFTFLPRLICFTETRTCGPPTNYVV